MMTCEDVNIFETMEAPFRIMKDKTELIELDSLFCVPASVIIQPVIGANKTKISTNTCTTKANNLIGGKRPRMVKKFFKL